jgi:hypothetical protein
VDAAMESQYRAAGDGFEDPDIPFAPLHKRAGWF